MNSSRWLEPQPVTVPDELAQFVGGHPLVAETLVRMGVRSVEEARAFLHPEAYEESSPWDLPDMERAVARLERALQEGERVCVWGDFDVDGQMSTTLLVSILRELGGSVTYHIPVRAVESHGVKVLHLAKEIEAGAELLLTCDTGVAAHEAVAYAREQGVDVVVTDHHVLPPTLPDACAVVNPHRLPPGHPMETLPGVGVAYELARALCERRGRPEIPGTCLDLVALGVVADVAEVVGEARYLLQRGLEMLREPRRLGLQALMERAGVNPATLNEEHIGFGLAPRLNALGRLDDANPIVDFLTTEDLGQARIVASQLESLNNQRKELVAKAVGDAEAQLQANPDLLKGHALVVAHTGWHPGVIGIVAGRLAEKYHRPTVVLSTPDEGMARGSARSIAGCDVTSAIATQAHLLEGFGGHPMAAGLAVRRERIAEFRRGLSQAVRAQVGEGLPRPELHLSGYVPLADLSVELADDLERLAPFGPSNPAPVLATRNVTVRSSSTLGREGRHLQLVVEDEAETACRVLWWRASVDEVPEGRFDLAYQVRASSFQGRRELQVTWVEARSTEEPVVEAPPPEVEVVDYRLEPHPTSLLTPYRHREGVQIWAEADASVEGRARAELEEGAVLVVWTSPPGPEEWCAALERVAPREVVLVARPPQQTEGRNAFLEQLAKMLMYAISHREGRARLARLAAATAQREATVRAGLAFLVARGYFTLESLDDEVCVVRRGAGARSSEARTAAARLQQLWQESEAYRHHFRRADPESLFNLSN